jgi:hypothetical protein
MKSLVKNSKNGKIYPNKRWMDKDISLLFDPPYILRPDDVILQKATIGRYYRKDNESLIKCENCGRPLEPLYYIILGIPPSPLIVDALRAGY